MPGIVGAVDFTGQVGTDEIVTRACEILSRNRAYKVWRHSFGSNITIATVHLDVPDRDAQPLCDKAGRTFAFLEGEIHLPDAVDNSTGSAQIQYILDIYKKRGREFACELNGSFLAVIYDAGRDMLIISTDRAASRPLYYAKTATSFYFSPEIKAILPNSDVKRDVDYIALGSYLTNGHSIGDRTLFKDIKVLQPATTMTVDIKTAAIQQGRYWEYVFDESAADRGRDCYVGELSNLVERAMERATKGEHRFVIALSGGVDSRSILGACLEKLPEFSAISWGETSDKAGGDVEVAKGLCRRFGVKHRFYRLDPSKLVDSAREWVYETEAATDALGNYPNGPEILDELRKDFDILLRGDECFGWFRSASDEAQALAIAGIGPVLDPRLGQILQPDIYQKLERQYKEEIDKISSSCGLKDYDNRKDYYYYNITIFRYQHPLSYYKQKSIEQRTPLLDNDILDFVVKLPSQYRVNKNLWVDTVATRFSEVMREGLNRTNSLPDWPRQFRSNRELRDFVINELTQDGKADDGFFQLFDSTKLESFIKSYFDGKPSLAGLKGRLLYSVRNSRLRSWRLSRFARGKIARAIKQKEEHPTHLLILRFLVLRFWFDIFRPTWPEADPEGERR